MAKTRTIRTGTQALTAAAETIDLDRRIYANKTFTQQWQKRSWEMYEEIGEVSAAANFMGDAFGRLKLFIGARSEDNSEVQRLDPTDPLPGFTTQQIDMANEALEALENPHGLAELQRQAGISLFQVGEIYLLGRSDVGGPEEWDTYSTEQITVDSTGHYSVKDSPDDREGRAINNDADLLMRYWRRSPRWPALATSSVKAALTILEELLLLTLEVRASTMSRVASGILAFPDSMDLVRTDTTDDDTPSPLLRDMQEHFTRPIKTPGDASAVQPFLMRGDADDIEKIRYITFGREDTGSGEKRAELLDRYANTINLSKEILMGKGDLNHWGAWLIDEEMNNNYVAPLMQIFTNGLTSQYLLPRLSSAFEGVLPPFAIGFELPEGLDDPEGIKITFDAFDKILISNEATRRRLNIPEEDAPTPEEYAERAARANKSSPVSTVDKGAPSQTASAKPRFSTAAAERELRLRLQVAGDAAMRRALERGGAKLRSLAQKDKAAKESIAASNVPNELLISEFPSLLASLDHTPEALFGGAFEAYGAQWDKQVQKAQYQLIELLTTGHVAAGLSGSQRQEAETRFDSSRTTAKAALLAAMQARASQLAFDPNPDAPEMGEYDPDLTVQSGMIRNSLILAGGSATRIDAHRSPLGTAGEVIAGLYSADIAMDLFRQSPLVDVEPGFTWVRNYSGLNPFDGHDLDGQTFSGPQDDGLLNTDSFPEEDYYRPGDHLGCSCDLESNLTWND